jgi:hypothetical protein
VSQLVAQLFQMRARMQKLLGMVQGQEAIAGIGDLMDSLKAEEKATMSHAARIFLVSFPRGTVSFLNSCPSFRHRTAEEEHQAEAEGPGCSFELVCWLMHRGLKLESFDWNCSWVRCARVWILGRSGKWLATAT